MKNRTKKIFVGGVPIDMSEQTLKDYFETFGKVRERGGGGWRELTRTLLFKIHVDRVCVLHNFKGFPQTIPRLRRLPW